MPGRTTLQRARRIVGWMLGGSLGALALGCVTIEAKEQPQGNPGSKDFAAYWADGSQWCALYGRCEIQSERECRNNWPTESETRRAVERALLTRTELDRCEAAARASDDCNLKLSCREYEQSLCAQENAAMQTFCAPVSAAIELDAVQGFDAAGSLEVSSREFAAYWANGSEWCVLYAACGDYPEHECLEDWPTAAEVRAAVEAVKLTSVELGRCFVASRAVDDCMLQLSCEEYAEFGGEDGYCTVEVAALETFCAPVQAALELQ